MVDCILHVTLNFLKKRVKQYQEKKLNDALSKIQLHLDMKIQLEQKIKSDAKYDEISLRNEILFHGKMIKIWKNNVEKIKKEMKRITD